MIEIIGWCAVGVLALFGVLFVCFISRIVWLLHKAIELTGDNPWMMLPELEKAVKELEDEKK